MESLESIARKKLENMEAGDVRRLLTKGKSSWSRSQNVTTKVDMLTRSEADLFKGDDELIELLVLEQVVKEKIMKRIDDVLASSRIVPYQISDRGIRIHFADYDMEKLKTGLNEAGLDFEPDYYNEVGYIKPVSKYKSVEGSLPEIKPILESSQGV